MMELGKILLGIVCFMALIWLYLKALKVYERISGHPPKSYIMEYLGRRNRLQTLFGKKDKDS
jgi:hypothetical protein